LNRETALNWIRKAENDLKTGIDEMNTVEPATDTVCFHMQQCVEKYLKAYLIYHGKEYPKSHNLAKLISLCAEIEDEFQVLIDWGVDELTDYATTLRYGEDFYMPSHEEARSAIELAKRVKDFVRRKLEKKGVSFEDETFH
jgi:HEPN domain-containing protein